MEFAIGELARRSGVKVPTIRYYEQVGLLPAPPRTQGQQRRYDESHASRLVFVRYARELGFEVEAIRELLAMSAKPEQSCAEVDEIARRHIAESDQRVEHLSKLRAELMRTVEECERGRVRECRVIGTLAEGRHDRAAPIERSASRPLRAAAGRRTRRGTPPR
ncbi:helix-turn-helix domain-containing protein [Bosea sp. AS-1]|uniref:MerR family transcriptional regulator n=1 Tax=Bosea sp. AS-1 TaxID=2015316 RepID=UPI000B76ED0D|nr:helix-turn-helix domain-containing protein [Bosea sp. AS-1]